ncbi:probable phytanoyl-CoA dioxygenase [Antedon mediterranea]|uniref:probable phytanoyl-CoA dioxygenase n=1 Tax=Antedon mediterranea TaxID=105859 RepID=UPI003AF813FF
MAALTSSDIESYKQNGCICLRNVFSSDWIEKIKIGIQKNKENPGVYSENLRGSEGSGKYFNDYCNWRSISEFEEFALYSPAAEIVGELLETKKVGFYHEHVLTKDQDTYKVTPWHMDQSYYPIDGEKVCSIWLPVDNIPLISSLQFVKGSHRWGKWFYPRKFATSLNYNISKAHATKAFEDVPDIDGGDYEIMSWEVQPGDAVIFHMKTLHGAPMHLSTTAPRRILSTRWLGDDAVIAERQWEISPPMMPDIAVGQSAICEEFPLVWTLENGKIPIHSRSM